MNLRYLFNIPVISFRKIARSGIFWRNVTKSTFPRVLEGSTEEQSQETCPGELIQNTCWKYRPRDWRYGSVGNSAGSISLRTWVWTPALLCNHRCVCMSLQFQHCREKRQEGHWVFPATSLVGGSLWPCLKGTRWTLVELNQVIWCAPLASEHIHGHAYQLHTHMHTHVRSHVHTHTKYFIIQNIILVTE